MSGALPVEAGARVGREQPGRYELLRELARGAQAVVHVAWDAHLGREVAFKQLRAPPEGAAQALTASEARFVREARTTAQLDHPGIAPLYEVGRRADGSLYATQRLVRGRTLEAALARCATPEERLALVPAFHSLCEAIAHAHGRGVVHCDLGPGNVLVQEDGTAVVLDWGAGRTAQEGAGEAERRADVRSLGAILHGVLVGASPSAAREAQRGLVQAAARAMGADAALPPATAAGLAEAVGAWLSQSSSAGLVGRRWGGRGRAAAAGFALLVAALAGVALWRGTPSGAQPALTWKIPTVAPPRIVHQVPAGPLPAGQEVLMRVRISAPAGVERAALFVRPEGAARWAEVLPLAPAGGDEYACTFPARLAQGRFAYMVVVKDAQDQTVNQAEGGPGIPYRLVFADGGEAARALPQAVAAPAGPQRPLAVAHQPPAPVPAGDAVVVRARVTAAGKVMAQLFVRSSSAGFGRPIDLRRRDGSAEEFEATLIVPAGGLDYYIQAYDELGEGPARAGSPEAPLHLAPASR